MHVTVTGKRKREIGLVVSAKDDCYTNDKRTSSVLDEEIKKRKAKYKTLEIHHQKKHVYRKFPFKESIKSYTNKQFFLLYRYGKGF